MKRLTIRNSEGKADADGWIAKLKNYLNATAHDCFSRCVERLAAYEDAGLEPEEVKRVYETLLTVQKNISAMLEDLRQYLQVEAEGRLVFLPCKVGSSIFRVDRAPNGKMFMSAYPEYFVSEYKVTDVYGTPKIYVFAHSVLKDGERATSYEVFGEEQFGETIFCSMEEAEAMIAAQAAKTGDDREPQVTC